MHGNSAAFMSNLRCDHTYKFKKSSLLNFCQIKTSLLQKIFWYAQSRTLLNKKSSEPDLCKISMQCSLCLPMKKKGQRLKLE